jgi:sugar/nucleoside kinase (ribokinase family)
MCVPYRLVTGGTAVVEVIPGPDGEKYVIPRLDPIPIPSPLLGDAIVLSPIMREIAPDSIPDVRGLLALDLQGFVRLPGDRAGGLDRDVDLAALLARVDVIKAADPELAALTPESRAAARSAIVLITHGDQGATIQQGERADRIEARPVPAPNTIGAGDTFLSAFIVALLDGNDTVTAGERAARFTEGVLRERLSR